MGYRKYDTYRETGIRELGAIPEKWIVKPIKYVSSINDESLPENTKPDYEIQYIDIGSVDFSHGITKREQYYFEDAPSRARRKVRDGDIIISTVRTYLKSIAKISNPDDNLIVSTGFAVIRPLDISSEYLGFFVKSEYFVSEVVSRSSGVSYPAINSSSLSTIKVAIPSIFEQKYIANFLSTEVSRIDTLIEKKQLFIMKLKEKRLAVITKAVTKGIDSEAELRYSGIEWLGNIPKHWEMKRLKYLARVNPSQRLLTGIEPTDEVSFVPMECVLEYGGMDTSKTKVYEDVSNGFTYFENDDVVIAKITPCFENGKGSIASNLINGIGFGTTELHVVRSNEKLLDNKFFFYITNSYHFMSKGESEMYGAGGQKRVPTGFLKNFLICYPKSLVEQKRIVDYIEKRISLIQKLSEKTERHINKLAEYKTALISAAVTGKIKVID